MAKYVVEVETDRVEDFLVVMQVCEDPERGFRIKRAQRIESEENNQSKRTRKGHRRSPNRKDGETQAERFLVSLSALSLGEEYDTELAKRWCNSNGYEETGAATLTSFAVKKGKLERIQKGLFRVK